MNRKILIVEDNEINMRLIKTVLGKKGYLLVEARDGEEALKAVDSEMPDLILMDVQIPKIDGLEVTRQLKNRPETKTIPIVAITALAMEGDREKVLDAGCDAYISKPINTRTLADDVSAVIEGRRLK